MARKKRADDTLIRIEENQAALRDCIETAKALAKDSERLIRRHREEMEEAKPENPAR